MTTLIRDGLVFVGGPDPFRLTSLVVDSGTITALEAPLEVSPEWDIIDASSMLVIPGLVNGHTHSYANLSRGLGANLPLEFFALEGAWAAANRTSDEQYLSTILGCIEMLKQGITTVLDQPGQDPQGAATVAQAYVDAGMRAVVAPMVWDRPYHEWLPWDLPALDPELWQEIERSQRPSTDDMLQVAADFAETWHDPRGRVRAGLGPFAPGRCSDRLLTGCAEIAAKWKAPLHTHLLETRLQATRAKQDYGRTMVEHLDRLGLITERFSGAHGVWLSAPEIDLLADRTASVVHNPVSNMTLGSGTAPVKALLMAGVNVALGTDGSNCGGHQSIFAAMKASAIVPRVAGLPHDAWITAPEALRMATENGAVALNDATIGTIAVGMAADLVLVSRESTYLTPLNNPAEQLVHAETGSDVIMVLVGGEVVVRDGRLTLVDEDAFLSEARDAMRSIAMRNAGERELGYRLSGTLASVWDELRNMA